MILVKRKPEGDNNAYLHCPNCRGKYWVVNPANIQTVLDCPSCGSTFSVNVEIKVTVDIVKVREKSVEKVIPNIYRTLADTEYFTTVGTNTTIGPGTGTGNW
jgi:uncharacterized Zn finger protein